MDLKPDEIESVKVIGELNGEDVKILRTFGGFHVCVGKKTKKSKKTEALAAGSHAALVAHHLTKEYGDKFRPAVCKSEAGQLEEVKEYNNLLPQELINKGFELFSLHKKEEVTFLMTKYSTTIGQYEGRLGKDSLNINSHKFLGLTPETREIVADSMAKMLSTYCTNSNVKKIER